MRTVAIIQARMGSSRLPGKVLLPIAGKPMLAWVVERTRLAEGVAEVVVATTTEPGDDAVAEFCTGAGFPVTRGSLADVLDRYVQAARQFRAEVVVRITADCPFIDPEVIARTVKALWPAGAPAPAADFSCDRLPLPWGRTLPIGLDVEAVTRTALETAWRAAAAPHHREHVMPYFYEDLPADALRPPPLEPGRGPWQISRAVSPAGFRLAQLHHSPDYGAVRWTVDTPEDLILLREMANRLGARERFTWRDLLTIWEQDPALAAINSGIRHKGFRDTDERLSLR